MAETKTYEVNQVFIGSVVSIYPSIDGIFENQRGYDYVIEKNMDKKVMQYLINIGHPAVTATVKGDK